MLKYSLILLTVYILYYTGIVVYDLFLKKEKSVLSDVWEEFLLNDSGPEERQQPRAVGIEDVENLRPPNSFLSTEIYPTAHQNFLEPDGHLEELRTRFENEQDLEIITNEPKKRVRDRGQVQNYSSKHLHEKPADVIIKSLQSEAGAEGLNRWDRIVSLSESSIVLVANYDGHKVFHSTI